MEREVVGIIHSPMTCKGQQRRRKDEKKKKTQTQPLYQPRGNRKSVKRRDYAQSKTRNRKQETGN